MMMDGKCHLLANSMLFFAYSSNMGSIDFCMEKNPQKSLVDE